MRSVLKSRKFWRWVLISAAFLICLGLWLVRDVFEAAWAYSDEYEAAKREGAIVSADDMRRMCAVKPEDNAAPILSAIFPKLPDSKSGLTLAVEGYLSPTKNLQNTGPRQQPMPTIERALKEVDAITGDLSLLLTKSGCDFNKQWEQGENIVFSEFAPIKQLAKIQCARGRYSAEQGNQEEAAKQFRIAFKLGQFAADSPTMIGALVGQAIDAIVFSTISNVAKSLPNDASLRAQLRSVLQDWSSPGDMTRPIIGEMYFSWSNSRYVSDDLATGENSDYVHPCVAFAARFPIVRTAWKTNALRWCRRIRKNLTETHGDPAAYMGATALDTYSETEPDNVSTMLGDMLAPTFTGAGRSYIRRTAGYEVCFATLEVLDERQRLAKWPAKLPVQRRDPFGNNPLKYEVVGDHARIWSIGMDHVDSHGKKYSEDHNSDDISVQL